MNTFFRVLLRVGRSSTLLLSTFLLCFANVSAAWADNPQIAGTGCVDASSSAQLGETPDYLSDRKFVSIGVGESSAMLSRLKRVGHTATIEEFLARKGLTSSQVGNRFVLLVGDHHLISTRPAHIAAIAQAKANGVPIVIEEFRKSEFKALTGLGLHSNAAVVMFAPGGRA